MVHKGTLIVVPVKPLLDHDNVGISRPYRTLTHISVMLLHCIGKTIGTRSNSLNFTMYNETQWCKYILKTVGICLGWHLVKDSLLFQETRLQAGMALTIFAFNNTPQQYAIREAGGIKYSVFEPFIDSLDEFHNCYAAFQVKLCHVFFCSYNINW